jgi:hypothetical protein
MIEQFFIATLVSLIDPIAIVGYALAAYLPRSWVGVIIGGTFAGVAYAGLSIALVSQVHTLNPIIHLGQFTACVVGALALRGISKVVRAGKGGKPVTTVAPHSPQWQAWLEHKKALGETTAFMEEGARRDIGWSVPSEWLR